MLRMPIWNYPGKRPAFQDTESLTVIEATAKVYAALNELIDDYNNFYKEVNQKYAELTEATSEEIQNFKDNVEKRLCEKCQEIEETIARIKVETMAAVEEYIANNPAIALPEVSEADNGKIFAVIDGEWRAASITYDEETESIIIVGG